MNKNNSASFKKTYGVGWPLQAKGFWAALVPDLPRHDAGDPGRDLFPGDLAQLSPGWVLTTPVLEGWVDPLLDRLRQLLAEGEGHHGPCQLLCWQLGDLLEEALQLRHLLGGRRLLPTRLVLRRAAGVRREAGRQVRHHESFPCPPLVGVAELEVGVDAPLAQREGGPAHNVLASVGRVPLKAVQSPPQIEVGSDPQVPLVEVDEDCNLSNQIGLEMSYLEPVEMEKPAEKRPRGQCEALLVEGLEHDHLVRVPRWELLPVAAPPPGDLILW